MGQSFVHDSIVSRTFSFIFDDISLEISQLDAEQESRQLNSNYQFAARVVSFFISFHLKTPTKQRTINCFSHSSCDKNLAAVSSSFQPISSYTLQLQVLNAILFEKSSFDCEN